MWQQFLIQIKEGNIKALARCISLIENEAEGYTTLLKNLPKSSTPIIGITGPPGAGKSTLTDALIGELVAANKKVAVVCVDPSSPFNLGALLGDRIRMNSIKDDRVYMRSLATRQSNLALSKHVAEAISVLKVAQYDLIILETQELVNRILKSLNIRTFLCT